MEGQLGDVLDGDCLFAGNDGAIADCGHDKEPMDSCLAWPNSLFCLDDMSSDVASRCIALCMDFKFTLKTVDCFSFSACVVFFIYWSGERGNLHFTTSPKRQSRTKIITEGYSVRKTKKKRFQRALPVQQGAEGRVSLVFGCERH
jgi:hypothetical protein